MRSFVFVVALAACSAACSKMPVNQPLVDATKRENVRAAEAPQRIAEAYRFLICQGMERGQVNQILLDAVPLLEEVQASRLAVTATANHMLDSRGAQIADGIEQGVGIASTLAEVTGAGSLTGAQMDLVQLGTGLIGDAIERHMTNHAPQIDAVVNEYQAIADALIALPEIECGE